MRAALDRLGAQLLALRGMNGLSQRGLSRLCGVDQGTISRLERGLAPGVRFGSVAKMIVVLDGKLVDGGSGLTLAAVDGLNAISRVAPTDPVDHGARLPAWLRDGP